MTGSVTLTCCISGCQRIKTGVEGGQWICSIHWRRHCPPRSLRRRTYHRFFREAKRHGWDWRGADGQSSPLEAKFWRFWDALVRVANVAEASDQFEAAEVARINQMFGWTDE